jgi:DNA-binding CsgD family transcriptional regulator
MKRRASRTENPPAPRYVKDGFVLMDLALRPIAMDWGATCILEACTREEHVRSQNGPESSQNVPTLRHIRQLATQEPSNQKKRFHIGNQIYSARTYRLLPQTASFPEAIAVLLRRECDAADVVLEAAAAYDLTQREREVVRGLAMGLTSKEIAAQMGISPATVSSFLHLVMVKVGAPNRAGIVAKLVSENDISD